MRARGRLLDRLDHFFTVSADSQGWQATTTFLLVTGVLDTTKAPPLLPRRPAVTRLLTVTRLYALRQVHPWRCASPGFGGDERARG
jgi:hypothetical protein